jgi:hypothetical protein
MYSIILDETNLTAFKGEPSSSVITDNILALFLFKILKAYIFGRGINPS